MTHTHRKEEREREREGERVAFALRGVFSIDRMCVFVRECLIVEIK